MRTEEDTFNILSRVPFSEVRLGVIELNRKKTSFFTIRKYIRKCGWTVADYKEELVKFINQRRANNEYS